MKMQRRINVIEEILKEGVSSLFIEGMTTAKQQVIEKCLRTFSSIDKINDAHHLYKLFFIKPFLIKNITKDKLENGKFNSTDGLSSLFHSILSFVFHDSRFIIDCAQNNFHEFDFLSSFWDEVSSHFISQLPNTFSFADPDIFHTVIFTFLIYSLFIFNFFDFYFYLILFLILFFLFLFLFFNLFIYSLFIFTIRF